MRIPPPEAGLVIRYRFLWRNEAVAGREEGRKARPSAIIAAVERSGARTLVTVAPITHAAPLAGENAIEIPPVIKKSLGLDDERSWIVTNQLNTFGWPGPDLEPIAPASETVTYGRLPRSLLIAVLRAVLGHVRGERAGVVKRTQ
jgi:hypothetical protein